VSTEASTWVRENVPSDDPTMKSLLMYLASYHNPLNGKLHPSCTRLVEDTGYSRATVWAKIKIAEAKGWIIVQRTADRRYANQYAINWKEVKIENPDYVEVVQEMDQGSPGDRLGSPGDGLGVVQEMDPKSKEENQIENQSKNIDVLSQAFARFWDAYPIKRNKKKAEQIWKRRKLDRVAELLVEDVKQRKRMDENWRKGYVPHATTYLNGDRWEDEIKSTMATGKRDYETTSEYRRRLQREGAGGFTYEQANTGRREDSGVSLRHVFEDEDDRRADCGREWRANGAWQCLDNAAANLDDQSGEGLADADRSEETEAAGLVSQHP
jgi:biotin operon repressor